MAFAKNSTACQWWHRTGFFHAAFCAEHVAFAAESEPKPDPALLQQDGGHKENGQDDLDDGEEELAHTSK